jgi:hypothetical protein
MRKQCPIKYYPPNGTERIRNKFLWFPKKINGECRWLEKASWLETSRRMWDVTCGAEWIEWGGVKWLNQNKYRVI